MKLSQFLKCSFNKRLALVFVIGLCLLLVQIDGGLGRILKVQIINYDEQEEEEGSLIERYRYKILNQGSKTIFLKPGEEIELEATLQNIGMSKWDLRNDSKRRFVLVTSHPKNRRSSLFHENFEKWQDPTRLYIVDGDGKGVIWPDDSVTFRFKAKAPSSPGVYRESFLPLVSGEKWLNNAELRWDVVVRGEFSSGYNYEVLEKSQDATLSFNSLREVKLKIKNTGKVSWYRDGLFPVRLIIDQDTDASLFRAYNSDGKRGWYSDNIVVGMFEDEVKPGETANFSFTISSPKKSNSYKFGLKLAIPGLVVFKSNDVLVWNFKVYGKKVALTFDDGYGDIDAFLDVLKREGAKATFFMLGSVAELKPDQMKRIIAEGHQLANHSYSHPSFNAIGADEMRWQLHLGREALKKVTGVDPYPYFRYPYGAHSALSDQVLAELGWKWYHWTNGTGDWKFVKNTDGGRGHIFYHATKNAPDKAIVLMHISSHSGLAVLPDIIHWYRENGYELVRIDEL